MLHTLFSFFGRTGRGGFWLAALVSIVLSIAAMFLAEAIAGTMFTFTDATGAPLPPGQIPGDDAQFLVNWNSLYTYLGLCIPAVWIYLAGSVKRCHDRGKSGWWMLLSLIPIAGFIWWLIDLGIMEGQEGPNKYGADPRAA